MRGGGVPSDWRGGIGLFLQGNASKGKRNDNRATNSQGCLLECVTPHSLSVHAPLTPSQQVDAGPSYLTADVLALLRADVEG